MLVHDKSDSYYNNNFWMGVLSQEQVMAQKYFVVNYQILVCVLTIINKHADNCNLFHRFGHQDTITAIDSLTRQRAITAGGRDGSVRIWKVVEESQLVFHGHRLVVKTPCKL